MNINQPSYFFGVKKYMVVTIEMQWKLDTFSGKYTKAEGDFSRQLLPGYTDIEPPKKMLTCKTRK